ncbi:MAG: FRG domain-containing protein [Chitinophagaceae bacterium]|nr:FRG domain-containing protein [Chitinophagaceae bacterium]
MKRKSDKKAITSFKAFVEEVESKKMLLTARSGYEFPLFRGHADGSWKLEPTLLRSKNLKNMRALFDQESAFFYDFINKAGHRIASKNSWHTLFTMRHHGVPTRLIDWTENLFVALYFALIDNPEQVKRPCIWVMDPSLLNKKSPKQTGGYIVNPEYDLHEYFDLFCKECKPNNHVPSHPIAFYPFRHHDRLIAQAGLFTMHGTNERPLNEQVPDCAVRIDIPAAIIPEIQLLLGVSGFNKFSIYQDFDSLAKYLKEIYHFV